MSDYPMLISNKLHSFRNFAHLNQNAIQTYPTILGILYLYIQLNLTASSSVAETPDGLHFEPSNS